MSVGGLKPGAAASGPDPLERAEAVKADPKAQASGASAAPAAPARPAAPPPNIRASGFFAGIVAGQASRAARATAAPAAPAAAPRAPAVDAKKVDAEVAKIHKAFKGLGTDEEAVYAVLEKNPPEVVRAIEKRFGELHGKDWGTLRTAINDEMSDAECRRALKALESAKVLPGDQGALQANIDKVLELRRAGVVSESDLVNHHGVTTDNKIELLVKGSTAFPKVFEEIDKAKDSIHVSYYIFNNDKLGNEFADKLIAAKQRGVDVRVMIDGIGSTQMVPNSGPRKIAAKMEAAGIEVIRNHVFDPTRAGPEIINHPDHRKLVLVDGKVGFTGGMNVGDHYVDEYHDLMVKVEGGAVSQMQAEWMTSWMHLGGKIDPGKDDATVRARYFPQRKPGEAPPGNQAIKTAQAIPGENDEIRRTYLDKIAKAEKSIYIENPYCTNPQVQDALIAAAKRGVDVHVILPGESDHGFSHLAARQKYPEMLKAGVKIYEYPGFNHGKVMVVDEKFTTIGSSNLDDVALYHIYELNLNVDDPKFAKESIDNIFKKDIPISRPMKAADISKLQIITGKFWNLFSHFI